MQCNRRRLEVFSGESAKGLLRRRLQDAAPPGDAPSVGEPRRLQGNCCPAPPGEQPSDSQLQAMRDQISDDDRPLQTGSKVNACSFTEFFDSTLGECVSGRCRTPYTRPDSDRFCEPIPDAELTSLDTTAAVTDSLRLSGLPGNFKMEDVLNGNMRADFDQEFARELAALLDIPAEMIVVQSVAEGSVVVNFRIVSPTAETDQQDESLVPAIVQMSLSSVRQNMCLSRTAWRRRGVCSAIPIRPMAFPPQRRARECRSIPTKRP